MTHTPGPWYSTVDNQWIREYKSDAVIAAISDGGFPDDNITVFDTDEQAANARLIAAAPDMLAALRFYVSICGNTAASVSAQTAREMYDYANTAIAKATA